MLGLTAATPAHPRTVFFPRCLTRTRFLPYCASLAYQPATCTNLHKHPALCSAQIRHVIACVRPCDWVLHVACVVQVTKAAAAAAAAGSGRRAKADKANPGSIGAPMMGVVIDVKVCDCTFGLYFVGLRCYRSIGPRA